MKSTLGERIAEYRKRKGLKQDELAESLGVSPQAVSKWENDISCPDIMLLPKLACLLSVSVDELLSGKKDDTVRYVPEKCEKEYDKMMLRILVNSSDGDVVKVNLPLPLVKVLISSGVSIGSISGSKIGNMNIDWSGILALVEQGVVGKLVEVIDSDGDTVEVVVE